MADVIQLTSLAQLNALSAAVTQTLVLQQEQHGQVNLDATAVAVNSQTAAMTKTGGNVLRYQPHVGDADIQGLFERIRLPIRTGTAARFKGLPGPADIGNGFQVIGSSNYGLAWLYRNLTQDLFPTAEYLGGGVRPAPHTVVNDGELTNTSPLTVLAIPTGVGGFNNVVQAQVTPAASAGSTINMTADVVDGADITSAIAINDDLGGVMAAQTVNVAITGGTLSGANATVIIAGLLAGTVVTETVTFTVANVGTPQDTTQTYDTITSVTATGFTAGTLNITAAYSITIAASALGLAAGALYGKVVIEGTDHRDELISSELRWTASALNAVQMTDKYFRTITRVTADGWSGGAIDILVNDQATRVTFQQQDDTLDDFFTLEISKGGVPFTYRDLVISNFTAALARSEPVIYTASVLGGIFAYRRNVDGGTAKTDISAFDDASEAAFTGPSVQISVDGTALPLTAANIGINHNLAPANYMAGSVFQAGKPVRDNERELTIGGTLQASSEDDFQSLAFRNATIPNVVLSFTNGFEGTFGDFPAQTQYICDEMEFANSTDFGVTGRARITHDLVLSATAERGRHDYQIVMDVAKYDDPVYRYA